VASESIVIAAIESVFRSFHRVPGRVTTLGMVDTHTELDENYLVVGVDNAQAGALIQAKVNQPALPIARHVAYLFGWDGHRQFFFEAVNLYENHGSKRSSCPRNAPGGMPTISWKRREKW
jgi:hypothetical protein